ncbi:hypothetical protein [Bradyrhizobium sp. BR 10289]|uniref:hypothetical protein n=1 Tax=Bradyrhizobium sp. BR 10289 TaxID=2749993 RepID=UPI001C647C43|nr:hypothetical protein [Bradyrhizobium sp. BR 10289]MBW7971558.1 hypothetical protein [Bradyrhizobium sp. BR 10289]
MRIPQLTHGGQTSRRAFVKLASLAVASGLARSMPAGAQTRPAQFRASDFLDRVGVGIHLRNKVTPYYTNFEGVVALLKPLGIMHLRDDAVVAGYITRDDDFYKRIRSLVQAGYRFDLVCQDPLNGFIFTPTRKVPDIYEWTDGGVEIFEGANEPNLVRSQLGPAISADHQRALYGVVKSTPALRKVLVASPSYIQKNVAVAENLSDAVDLINIHPYPGMEHPETRGAGELNHFIADAERIFGKKPVLVSESGYHTALTTTKSHLPVSEPIKTRYLPRLLLFNFLASVKRTYIYELIDSFNNGTGDPESNFGLATFDCAPKPSYHAVAQLIALFRRPSSQQVAGRTLQFDLKGTAQDVFTATFMRDDGSHLYFFWLGVAGWNPSTRTAKDPTSRRCTVTASQRPATIKLHRFQDDGSLSTSEIAPTGGPLDLDIADQLQVLEVTA